MNSLCTLRYFRERFVGSLPRICITSCETAERLPQYHLSEIDWGGVWGMKGEFKERIAAKAGFRALGKRALAGMVIVIALIVSISFGSLALASTSHSFMLKSATMDVSPQEGNDPESADGDTVFVHVAGCVEHPGLYEIEDDLRVYDAIQLAGGATEEGMLDALNLASPLVDGMKIHVPSIDEQMQPSDKANAADTSSAPTNLISINAASASQLEALPGIGKAMAERIVAYRTTAGPFSSIEQLREVRGIGEKKLAAIRDSITL